MDENTDKIEAVLLKAAVMFEAKKRGINTEGLLPTQVFAELLHKASTEHVEKGFVQVSVASAQDSHETWLDMVESAKKYGVAWEGKGMQELFFILMSEAYTAGAHE